jgi:hypothetical protein
MAHASLRADRRPRALPLNLYSLMTLGLAFGGLIAALIIAAS